MTIGTRFPAMPTSLGKVLLAALPLAEAERVLAEPSRSGITKNRCSPNLLVGNHPPSVTCLKPR